MFEDGMSGSQSLMIVFLVFVSWFGGAVITGLLASKWKNRSGKRWFFYGLIWGFFLLFFVPWILLLILPKGTDGTEASTTSSDFAQGAKYSYAGGASAIAMDTDRSVMRVKNGMLIKEYPFGDVREWHASLISGGGMVGFGVAGGLTALAASTGAKRENAKASGFYIKVRDIDHPQWRIEMPSQDNQNRWMEIFNQLINKN